jgi:hypothetical protein
MPQAELVTEGKITARYLLAADNLLIGIIDIILVFI